MQTNKILIANSYRKQNLDHHMISVALTAVYIFRKHFEDLRNSIEPGRVAKYERSLCLSAIIHDIGKATGGFQKMLYKYSKPQNGSDGSKSVIDPDTEDQVIFNNTPKLPHHNEISWAIADQLLSNRGDEDGRFYRDMVLWLVYHHHKPRPVFENGGKRFRNSSEILSVCNQDNNHNNMKTLTIEMFGIFQKYYNTEGDLLRTAQTSSEVTPPSVTQYYNKDVYTSGLHKVLQSCLITADRWVSKELTQAQCEELSTLSQDKANAWLDLKYQNKSTLIPYTDLQVVSDLDKKQANIAHELTSNDLMVLESPPGKGKTRISIRWWNNLLQSRKIEHILYVLPRNSTAENLYYSILDDLKAMGVNLTVELYLSGARYTNIEDSHHHDNAFSSQIIITNIDSVVLPLVRHVNLNRVIQSCSSNTAMIFDEFHEILQDNSIPALFQNMVAARVLTKAPTLLMSATPIDLSNVILLDNWNQRLVVDTEPRFSNEIDFSVVEEWSGFSNRSQNELIVCHTVGDAQVAKVSSGESTELYHAKYIDEEKNSMISEILQLYGANGTSTNGRAVATRIVESSLNASWDVIYENPLSPESTIQRLGRCQRFSAEKCQFVVINNIHKTMSKRLYSSALANQWVEFLTKKQKDVSTKQDLYNIRKEFNLLHKKDIDIWIRKIFDNSHSHLSKLGYVTGGSQDTINSVIGSPREKVSYKLKLNIRESKGNYILAPVQCDGQLTSDRILIAVDDSVTWELANQIKYSCESYIQKANQILGKHKNLTKPIEKKYSGKSVDSGRIILNSLDPSSPLIADGYIVYDTNSEKRGLGVLKLSQASADNTGSEE